MVPSERLARPVGRPERQPREVDRSDPRIWSRGGTEMEWQFIVAIVVMIPVILLPVALVWYLNLGGMYAAVRDARKKRVAEKRLATDKVRAE